MIDDQAEAVEIGAKPCWPSNMVRFDFPWLTARRFGFPDAPFRRAAEHLREFRVPLG